MVAATGSIAICPNADIKEFGHLEPEAEELLNAAARRLNISARAYMRSVKVARTIARPGTFRYDTAAHLSEALALPPPERISYCLQARFIWSILGSHERRSISGHTRQRRGASGRTGFAGLRAGADGVYLIDHLGTTTEKLIRSYIATDVMHPNKFIGPQLLADRRRLRGARIYQ